MKNTPQTATEAQAYQGGAVPTNLASDNILEAVKLCRRPAREGLLQRAHELAVSSDRAQARAKDLKVLADMLPAVPTAEQEDALWNLLTNLH